MPEFKLEPELLVVGDHIALVERTVKSVASFDDIAAQARDERGDKLEITPPLPAVNGSCRIYASAGKFRGMLIQNNPTIRKIDFRYGGDIESFNVSLPFIWVFCVFKEISKDRFEWVRTHLCATYVNFVKNDLSDTVYRVPLPNQHDRGLGMMCTGSAFTGFDKSMANTAMKWIMQLWESTFNSDLSIEPPAMLRKAYQSGDENRRECIHNMLKEWAKLTEKDKLVGMKPEFGLVEYGCTLRGFISHCLR